MISRPAFLIPVAIIATSLCLCVRSHGQPASPGRLLSASHRPGPVLPSNVQAVGTGISKTTPGAAEIDSLQQSKNHRTATILEQSPGQTEPNRRPTAVLLTSRRETTRDFSSTAEANSRQPTGKRITANPTTGSYSNSKILISPQELEPIDMFMVDDEPEPNGNLDDGSVKEQDLDAAARIEAKRAAFRNSLRRPLPADPMQLALRYVNDEGEPVPDSEFRQTVLTQFGGFNGNPFGDGFCRLDAYACCWHPKSHVWKSPDLCYGPLYFEEVNLERFGGRYPILQPGISAVHFFGNTIRLPYSMGLQSPHHCHYSAGYGRPGNQYCYQCERPVWSLKAGTFQALLVTGLVFGLP